MAGTSALQLIVTQLKQQMALGDYHGREAGVVTYDDRALSGKYGWMLLKPATGCPPAGAML